MGVEIKFKADFNEVYDTFQCISSLVVNTLSGINLGHSLRSDARQICV